MRNKHIIIGQARTLTVPSTFTYTPDDRQTQVELINGVCVQDWGRCAAGDKVTFSADFSTTEFEKVWSYWTQRTLVNITDLAGNVWESCRVIVRSYTYVEKHEQKAVSADIEVWRV